MSKGRSYWINTDEAKIREECKKKDILRFLKRDTTRGAVQLQENYIKLIKCLDEEHDLTSLLKNAFRGNLNTVVEFLLHERGNCYNRDMSLYFDSIQDKDVSYFRTKFFAFDDKAVMACITQGNEALMHHLIFYYPDEFKMRTEEVFGISSRIVGTKEYTRYLNLYLNTFGLEGISRKTRELITMFNPSLKEKLITLDPELEKVEDYLSKIKKVMLK